VTNGGAPVSAANIQSYMNQVWVQLVRGSDAPDMIVADNNYYRAYLESLQAIQRISDPELASIGFQTLKYMTADVVLDGGFGGGCPTNSMYFLNNNYIFFRPHKERFFAPIGDERFATNQDAMVKLIGFAGNMTVLEPPPAGRAERVTGAQHPSTHKEKHHDFRLHTTRMGAVDLSIVDTVGPGPLNLVAGTGSGRMSFYNEELRGYDPALGAARSSTRATAAPSLPASSSS
jgi:hypothetical protein